MNERALNFSPPRALSCRLRRTHLQRCTPTFSAISTTIRYDPGCAPLPTPSVLASRLIGPLHLLPRQGVVAKIAEKEVLFDTKSFEVRDTLIIHLLRTPASLSKKTVARRISIKTIAFPSHCTSLSVSPHTFRHSSSRVGSWLIPFTSDQPSRNLHQAPD